MYERIRECVCACVCSLLFHALFVAVVTIVFCSAGVVLYPSYAAVCTRAVNLCTSIMVFTFIDHWGFLVYIHYPFIAV